MHLERLLLIRHGESVGNQAASTAEDTGAHLIGLQNRDADTPLSTLGEAQADALGAALRAEGIDGRTPAWSSPYTRAADTALRAFAAAGSPAVPVLDERLRDRELGILDRLSSHGVAARFPDEAARRARLGKLYYRPPGGESWADVALRLRSFLSALRDVRHRTAVLFAHEAVIYLVRYVLEGWDERRVLAAALDEPAPNASVTELVCDRGGSWSAVRVGEVSHLLDSGVPATMHRGRIEPKDLPDEDVPADDVNAGDVRAGGVREGGRADDARAR